MITQDEAIQMAREVGSQMTRPLAPHEFSVHTYTFSEQQLTALCNAVRRRTLLEAAEYLESSEFMKSDENMRNMYGQSVALRRMAGESNV